jgi:Protein of unknown function (DUF3306)
VAEHDDGFLSRWARRKAQVKQGAPVAAEARTPVVAVPPAVQHAAQHPAPVEAASSHAPAAPTADAAPPLPTLDDVAQLTKDSDYSRFVAQGVDPGVRNAAMKKLFTDPHFNVMDGLDIYIDDYNTFEPIPKSMLRQLVSARALGLLDDELEEQPQPDNGPEAELPHDEDADLQLQPDDAAGQPGAGQGLADGADPAGPALDPVPPRST